MDRVILKEIGLLDAEIEVYLFLLRRGASLVSQINKDTGLHRTHIYDLLEKLKEKGLVSVFIQSGKNVFKPSAPQRLLGYLNEKQDKIQSLLPELESVMNMPQEDTSVELFKGIEGLKTVMHDIQSEKEDYCAMGGVKDVERAVPYIISQHLKSIAKLGIKERIILDKKETIMRAATGQYRYLKSKENVYPSTFLTYADKVAIFVWHLPYFVIVIKNNDVARTYKNFFEFFWKLAKPL